MEAVASGVFVGRVRELGQLERVMHRTAEGSGSAVLVAGEAGIGKSRLVHEVSARAQRAGFQVLHGRCLDLVGTELPFQPFVEALRSRPGDGAGSQLQVFEQVLETLTGLAAAAPVLLVVEDLHWADVSTLDLVVFLAHHLEGRRVVLVATCRADEAASADRVRRLVDGVRRSGALVVELGPLGRDEVAALLAARAGDIASLALTATIVARSEGNPFFAEELLAAAGDGSELPRGLRDLLMQRVARLDGKTQAVLRLAAAAGRDVSYALVRATSSLPEREVGESLRSAVENGVLVPEQATSSFRFRHALLAEAVYATVLPGEREQLHSRLADELGRGERYASPAELAPHWEAAGRPAEALAASVEAARETVSVFGLAESLAHLERALRVWDAVADPAELVGLDLAELCSWAAQLASDTGAAPRAVELVRRAIALVGEGDPRRAALLHDRLGAHLVATGSHADGLAARERAVELVPAHPPSPERAQVLAGLGNALMLAWRHEESSRICGQALTIGHAVGARRAEFVALAVLGVDLAYLGRGDEALAKLRVALRLAEENGDPLQLRLAYVYLTDVLTMLGRPRESAEVAAAALAELQRRGIEHTGLVTNQIDALVAIGEWDDADRVSSTALRASTASWPHLRLVHRAELEIGRGDFDEARAHLDAVRPHAAGILAHGGETYDVLVVEHALWERRWTDADKAVRDGLKRARSGEAALIRVQLCAQGLRAQAELVALARARRDVDAVRQRLGQTRRLLAAARHAAAESATVTPISAGWRAVAEAEYGRSRGLARPEAWSAAAATWDQLERTPVAAYCRWRQAEALVTAGAPRAAAAVPLRQAHAVAVRLGAKPLLRELELLAERARVDVASLDAAPARVKQDIEDLLGLTRREAEVLTLVGHGLTNREIAAELVISVKTAGVHVSHILRKLDVPNRREAAALAHRLALPRAAPDLRT